MTSKSSLLTSIKTGLGESPGKAKNLQWVRNLHGGDINRAALIQSGEKKWFVKYHNNAPAGMFETEATALAEISKTGCIRVPEPIAWGVDGGTSWLVLEYLDMVPHGPASLLGPVLRVSLSMKSDDLAVDQVGRFSQWPSRQAWHADDVTRQNDKKPSAGVDSNLINGDFEVPRPTA